MSTWRTPWELRMRFKVEHEAAQQCAVQHMLGASAEPWTYCFLMKTPKSQMSMPKNWKTWRGWWARLGVMLDKMHSKCQPECTDAIQIVMPGLIFQPESAWEMPYSTYFFISQHQSYNLNGCISWPDIRCQARRSVCISGGTSKMIMVFYATGHGRTSRIVILVIIQWSDCRLKRIACQARTSAGSQ